MSTIHLISHTHWDREWYLTFQQFRLKLVHLMDHLLDILENQPDFKHFLLDGQVILIEDYLKIRPEREDELRQLIAAGRILVGPWYISPDEFLVAPEAHIRNLLEGKNLCQKYGDRMLVGYLPDSFGHIGQMPQILRGFGIDSACLWRGLSEHPCELIWRAPDDSFVLLGYLRDSYGNAASLTSASPASFSLGVDELSKSLRPYSSSGQILLMNGMDHMEPSDGLASKIRFYQSSTQADTLIHSSLPRYFDLVRTYLETSGREFPEVKGELRTSKRAPLLPNILSTRIWLKQRNHTCEVDLLKWVEPLSTWAYLLEQTQPPTISNSHQEHKKYLRPTQAIIEHAWKLLMECHPHDSICGTSIDQVAREMGIRFDQVEQINQELIAQSLDRVSRQVDTAQATALSRLGNSPDILSAVVVFNPNDGLNTGIVSIPYKLPFGYSSVVVIDDQGKSVPLQQSGMGQHELINTVMGKKELKQSLGIINEGSVVGMVIKHFEIQRQGARAIIIAIISDQGRVSWEEWKIGLSKVEAVLVDPTVEEYLIYAVSDPEVRLSLLATDVPGHGYRSYWIRGLVQAGTQTLQPTRLNPLVNTLLPLINAIARLPFFSSLLRRRKVKSSKPPYRIENEYFIIEALTANGTLSVTDKRNHQVYAGLNRFLDQGDCGDLYNFCPPLKDKVITANIKNIEVDTCEIYQRLKVNYTMDLPCGLSADRKSRNHQKVKISIVSEITLVAGVPRIDIVTQVDNRASDHRLRVHFPAPFDTGSAWHDGHFEVVQRAIALPVYDETWEEPPRPEVPQREFTSLTDGRISLTIANRGLPEVEVLHNASGNAEIALTLLRCVGWLSRDDIKTRKGHAGPMGIETPEAQMHGIHTFSYSIIPEGEDWMQSIHQAQAFNAPLRASQTEIHPGILPPSCSMVENGNSDFIITCLKLSEDKSSLVLRGFNILSTPIDVTLKFWKPFNHASLASLDEKIEQEIPISAQGEITLHLGGHKITTLRLSD